MTRDMEAIFMKIKFKNDSWGRKGGMRLLRLTISSQNKYFNLKLSFRILIKKRGWF